MKKFKFTLEKVMKFKQQQLEIEMNALSQLRFQLQELEDRYARLQLERDVSHAKYQEEAKLGMSMHEIKKYQYIYDSITEQMKAILVAIEDKKIEIEQQLLVVLDYKKDVSGLEKLKEKQWTLYLEESRKADNEFILEMVAAKLASPSQA